MKKLIALVLACLMLFSLCSCGKNIKELKKGESVEIAYSQDGADKAYKALEKDLKNKDSEISKIQMNFEINEKTGDIIFRSVYEPDERVYMESLDKLIGYPRYIINKYGCMFLFI